VTARAETFAGFGEGAVEFYDGLLADNSKAYWTDHRGTYESDVLAPMRALLAVLEPEFGPGKIFRPYRDVRFSRDKTPYKTACGAIVGPFYVQVSADGLLAAGGQYRWVPDQLARFRAAVDDDRRGRDLEARIATVTATDVEGAPPVLAGDRLATRPRGSPPITRGWSCCATAGSTPTAGGSPTTRCTRRRRRSAWRRCGGRRGR
jgi:uncharacterized protein (DUF2461 family)